MKPIATLLLVLSTLASAQETTPPPLPPPEPVAAPPPVELQGPTPQLPAQLGNALLPDPGNRFRWGISGNLGALAPTNGFTPALSVDARFGWQFSNMVSLYAVVGVGVGIQLGAAPSYAGQSGGVSNGLFTQYLGGEVEWMLGDLFFVAAGPVVNNAAYNATLFNTGLPGVTAIEVQSVGMRFALDARAGFHLGSIDPQTFRRSGFSIGLQAMTTFYGGAALTQVKDDGTRITSTGLAVGVMPMLMLGYDAR